ncbi:MAG: hypothetical protein ACOYJE_07885 [Bacteroidaceae bacterium]|jgi:hypothetical protein
MASRRILKKNLSYLCDQIECDCIFLLEKQCSKEGHAKGLYLDKALEIREDFGKRISHVEKGMKPKDFFKKWHADLSKSVADLYRYMEEEYKRTEGETPKEAQQPAGFNI